MAYRNTALVNKPVMTNCEYCVVKGEYCSCGWDPMFPNKEIPTECSESCNYYCPDAWSNEDSI